MILGTLIKRAADSSLLLRSIRRLSRDSFVCAVIAAVMRSSLAYLGGSAPAETDERSLDTIEGVWAIALDSVLVRAGLRGVSAVSDAWHNSGTARTCDRIRDIEVHRRVQLIGWIVLVGTLTAGVAKFIFEGPWPGLSILIWAVVLAGAVGLVVGPRQVFAAWKEYRASNAGRSR